MPTIDILVYCLCLSHMRCCYQSLNCSIPSRHQANLFNLSDQRIVDCRPSSSFLLSRSLLAAPSFLYPKEQRSRQAARGAPPPLQCPVPSFFLRVGSSSSTGRLRARCQMRPIDASCSRHLRPRCEMRPTARSRSSLRPATVRTSLTWSNIGVPLYSTTSRRLYLNSITGS
jgi:hypothetical protein